jgi:hypothetical protein
MNTPPGSPKQEFSTPFAPIKNGPVDKDKDVKFDVVQSKLPVARELFPDEEGKKGVRRELFPSVRVPN